MSRADIEAFLGEKRVAIVGVSRTELSYTRTVYRAFLKNGYDAVPVHPAGGDFDGRTAGRTVGEISPPVGAALILAPPSEYPTLTAQCLAAGIRKLWFRRAAPSADGAIVISAECPLMWLPEGEWIHGFHKKLRGWIGTLPR